MKKGEEHRARLGVRYLAGRRQLPIAMSLGVHVPRTRMRSEERVGDVDGASYDLLSTTMSEHAAAGKVTAQTVEQGSVQPVCMLGLVLTFTQERPHQACHIQSCPRHRTPQLVLPVSHIFVEW